MQYEDLAFELKQQWQLTEIIVIPLVLSATGPSLTCVIKVPVPSSYHHAYCQKFRNSL
jgi:hypothetical protein